MGVGCRELMRSCIYSGRSKWCSGRSIGNSRAEALIPCSQAADDYIGREIVNIVNDKAPKLSEKALLQARLMGQLYLSTRAI